MNFNLLHLSSLYSALKYKKSGLSDVDVEM